MKIYPESSIALEIAEAHLEAKAEKARKDADQKENG